jgi:uncharacterized short protein YbdD (DUF466 family)
MWKKEIQDGQPHPTVKKILQAMADYENYLVDLEKNPPPPGPFTCLTYQEFRALRDVTLCKI